MFRAPIEILLAQDYGTEGATSSGRYVIVFGGPEAFTIGESVSTLFYLPVIWFGAYGGAPPHWNWWALIPLGILVAGIALITQVLVRRSRRRADDRNGAMGGLPPG